MKALLNILYIAIVLLSFFGLVIGCTKAQLYPLPAQYPLVTLEIQNYCPHVIGSGPTAQFFGFKDIFYYNAQAYFSGNQYTLDTDGDGLPDSYEEIPSNMTLFNISYLYQDTPQSGYRDNVRIRLGIQATAISSLPICETGIQDSDSDGLSDCEEELIGTLDQNPDTDGDGILDGIEYRFGMDPNDPNDADIEFTGDNYTNYQKVKWGIPINTLVTSAGKLFFPVYNGPTPTANPTGSCTTPTTFTISNISILPGIGGDSLWVRTLETPESPGLAAPWSQFLNVIVPANVVTGSTIIVPNGIAGQTITNPNIIAPGGG